MRFLDKDLVPCLDKEVWGALHQGALKDLRLEGTLPNQALFPCGSPHHVSPRQSQVLF